MALPNLEQGLLTRNDVATVPIQQDQASEPVKDKVLDHIFEQVEIYAR